MEKVDMKTTAKSVFERYKDRDKVFVTADGQAFFDEIAAKNHRVKNRTGKELGMETFLRDEVMGSAASGKKTGTEPTTKVANSTKKAPAKKKATQTVQGDKTKGNASETIIDASKDEELKTGQE